MQHLVGILGFNNQARVDKCIASVLADLPPDSRVVLVDNGVNPLKAPAGCEYQPVNFQTHGGFTAALRLFLCDALAGDYATATFLNDDLALEPGCLAAMIAKAQEPHVGLANPVQVDMYNPQIVICAGTGKAYPAGRHKVDQRGTFPMPVEDVRWMPFCATTFNLEAVRDIGMPDPNMRIWFSDSDYCLRARLHGWRVVNLGDKGVVRHEHSASVNAMDPAVRERQFLADQAAFDRKWGGSLLAEYST